MNWEAVIRTALISILGLIPSLLISIAAVLFVFTALGDLVDGRYAFGMFMLTVSSMSIFGTFTLIQHLLGSPLHELRAGMLAGLATMVVVVTQIPVRVYLDSLGVPGMLPKENLALAVGAINSVIAIIPLAVYSRLVYLSWRPVINTQSGRSILLQ